MEVRHGEGVAIHIGPKPCIPGREARGEAPAGERIGQPLSRVRIIPGADACSYGGRQHAERVNASARRGPRPWYVQTPCAGTWRSHDRPGRHAALVRIGKVRSRNR